MNETRQLAEYAAALSYDDLPLEVVQRAKDTIADTVAVMAFGHDLPWSRMIASYVGRYGSGGQSRVLGHGARLVHAPFAALANGAFAHAFELDSSLRPSTGAHPGATVFSATLAVAQEQGLGGRDLITAFVAGTEVMGRIARATRRSNERRGFHAPGTTGTFGGASACGRLLRFDTAKMVNALGIAGSLSSGLMEFASSGTGGMVKRLHFGRAAEGGVLAASLAGTGFTGPHSVIEGRYGFLRVFCDEWDLSELTRGLGEVYLTLRISMKRFACHGTAQTSVQAVLDLQEEHGIAGTDVVSVTVEGNEEMVSRHSISEPADIQMAQYSIPFCVALAFHRDPLDPRSFDNSALRDPGIRSLASRVTLTPSANPEDHAKRATAVMVALKDGRTLIRRVDDFKGTPDRPLSPPELRDRFLVLTRHCDHRQMTEVFDRVQSIERETALDWLRV